MGDCATMVVPMATSSEKSDEKEITNNKIRDALTLAKDFYINKKNVKALEITEKTISDYGRHQLCSDHHRLQGDIFFELAQRTDITEKCVYLFASVGSYSMVSLLRPVSASSLYCCARSLDQLGDQLALNKFYKKAVSKAKKGLEMIEERGTQPPEEIQETKKLKTQLLVLKELATGKMESKASVKVPNDNKQMILPKEEQGIINTSFARLKDFWVKLDEKTKRECLVVDFKSLLHSIQNRHGNEVKENFEKCARVHLNDRRWRWWKCRICPQVNYCHMDCRKHILDNHVPKFVPLSTERPKCVDKVLSDMIRCGGWEPVDTAAARDLIKGRTKSREEFVYVNGWCSDWPVAKDENRKNILKQLSEVLKSSCPNKKNTLSCTLWRWLIDYTEEKLELPQVPGSCLDKCDFFKSPQCICFLDLKSLKHILEYFSQLTTDCRTDLVLTVVNRFWENSRVKEIIDLEPVNFHLLLDQRLLEEGEDHFDDIGTVTTYDDSSEIYEHVIPKGDKIISWVLDCPEVDKIFVSQIAKGVHNLEMWLAVLRIVRCAVLKVKSNYGKRRKMRTYEDMLVVAETICDKEDKRKNTNQRSRYALMLQMECEERVKQDNATKHCFLNVLRDVLEGAESPRRYEVLEDNKLMECISRLPTTARDDDVRTSMLKLRKAQTEKSRLITSKILLSEFACRELNEFPKLSQMEYRLVVLPFVKMFIKDKLTKMMKNRNRTPPVAAGASAEQEHKKGRR